MHGMVKSFLDAQKERENKERQELLIELGFFEKEYSPNNVYCEAYPFAEWNAEQKCQNFYKKVAIEMSEEEFLPYRQHFYPVDGENTNESDFEQAWRCHYRRNDHHWQYWVADDGTFINYGSVDEKMCAYLEMICDWQAMGYAMGDSAPQYYRTHKDEIRIDPNWIAFVEEILDSLETYIAKKG